jgi:twinkle protein
MSAVISRLDAIAAQRGVIVTDVDLSSYMSEEMSHDVRSIHTYAEEVAELIFCPQEEQGVQLAFRPLDGKFAFRSHEMSVWTGYKGHGKSAFISQAFLFFIKRGQKVFIISPEFHPARLIERMIYQHFQTRQISEDMLMEFFNWAGQFMFVYGKQTSLKPDDVVALCRYAYDKHKVDHILIDSLMKCGIGTDDYTKQKTFVDRIQNIAHAHGPHVHLVAHARKEKDDDSRPPRLHDVKGASEIADMVENVLVVWRNKDKEKAASMNKTNKLTEPDAFFVVEAQRNADGWIGAVPLWYSPQSLLFSDSELKDF